MEAGRTAVDVAPELGVSKHTIYAWKAKSGSLAVNEKCNGCGSSRMELTG